MTEDELTRIAWYAAQASPAPTCVMQIPDDADPVAWFAEVLAHTGGETVYGVALGTPEDVDQGAAIVTALTGNGPTALANAIFYRLCHTAVPLLIAEIRRLRGSHPAEQEETPCPTP